MLVDNIKYSIVSIDDRAIDNKNNTRRIMSNFEEISIDCVNGNAVNIKEMLDNLEISLKNWSWYSVPKNGEIGLWLSNINLFNKMINEDIQNVLLFEDDAIINDLFPKTLSEVASDAPNDYDFISLVFPASSKHMYRDDANVGLDTLCLAKYNHFGTYAILWSKQGAQKMMDILKSTGIKYPIDIFMYEYLLKEDMINGYSLSPNREQVVFHGHDKYGSVIDAEGRRGKFLDV